MMILRFGVTPTGINGFSPYREVACVVPAGSLNDSIEAGEPELLNLSALRLKGVTFCPKAQLNGCQLFGMAANSRLNECPGKPKRGSSIVKAAKCNMEVRVLSIVVYNGDPFQLHEEALLDPSHQVASVLFKIHPLAEFWRNDDLEHPFIARGLPGCEPLCQVYSRFGGRKSDAFDVLFLCRTLPCNVVSVRLPLAGSFIG
jgi:hypothetical protein